MPLNHLADGLGGLPFSNQRWLVDLQQRWSPALKLQQQLDSIVRPNRPLELAGRQV